LINSNPPSPATTGPPSLNKEGVGKDGGEVGRDGGEVGRDGGEVGRDGGEVGRDVACYVST